MCLEHTRQRQGTRQLNEQANSIPVKAELKSAQFMLQVLLPIYTIL